MFSLILKTLAVCAGLCGGCLQLQGILVQTGQRAATISHIDVTGDNHDLGVEITATSPITPRVQTVTDTDRLIVDIPEALPSSALHKILVNRGKLRDIRVGLLSANPRIARVVLDLMAPTTQYRVSPVGNTIVIKLSIESGELAKEPEPGPAPIAPTTNTPMDSRPTETTSLVTTPPPVQSLQPSRARWILPILVMGTVLAMLVIAVVAHLQNKRGSRGL
jgi:AMIN domain-containing protein